MTLPLTHAIFVALLGFVYLAVGAAIIGFLDRRDPAYDYGETWWIWMIFWPFAIAAMLGAGVCITISAPLRWIYHRVRLWGREREQ